MSTRRNFLKLLGGAAAVTIAPKIALGEALAKAMKPVPLVPIATMRGNQLLSPDLISKEAFRILQQNLVKQRLLNRKFDREFVKAGARIVQTLTIRKPHELR